MFHMKRNNIKEEIFILLRKDRGHQREIARLLNLNQTTVRRMLVQLEKENIIDYKKQGKNNVYFIQDSLDSKVYERMVEYYKLQKILKNKKIRKVVREINELMQENKLSKDLVIVLFGSYAKFSEHKNSDIDIYINSVSKKDKQLIESLSEEINVKLGKFNKESFLAKEIIKGHIILNSIEGYFDLVE